MATLTNVLICQRARWEEKVGLVGARTGSGACQVWDGMRRVRLDAPRAAGKVAGVCKLVYGEGEGPHEQFDTCVRVCFPQVSACLLKLPETNAVGQEDRKTDLRTHILLLHPSKIWSWDGAQAAVGLRHMPYMPYFHRSCTAHGVGLG
jgi:hypothetical protein